jgi:hypothetical protein
MKWDMTYGLVPWQTTNHRPALWPMCGRANVVMKTSEPKLLNANRSTTRKRLGVADIRLMIET